jgi:hypothetical protein
MSFHDPHPDSFHDPHLDLITAGPSPGWRVVSFIDPAGTGSDLAFTDGLSAFGLPELLLWARPTEGFDPGADWLLSHRERSRLLNRWALELIAGTLTTGAEREERFDGGHTVARFRFGRPSWVSALNHPYLPERSRVISMAWSLLRRAPIARPPTGLTPAMARRMERWITEADAITLGRGLRPGTLDQDLDPAEVAALPVELAARSLGITGPDRFGPMTRWVDARIGQVLAVDAEAVAGFLNRLRLARYGRCEDCLLDDLLRLATRSQRDGECREASRTAQDLSLTLAGPPGQPTALWRRAVLKIRQNDEQMDDGQVDNDRRDEPQDDWLDDDRPAEFRLDGGLDHERPGETLQIAEVNTEESELRTLLSDGLELLLVSAALADVCAPAQIASTTGPWEWALNDERLPGRLWLARPALRQATRQLLAPATPDHLADAAERFWQTANFGPYRALGRLVGGLQTSAAASAQQGALLRRDQRRGLPRPIVRAADQLAGQLLTAIARPRDFPEEYWDLLRQSLFPLAPELPLDLPTETP